MKICIVFVLLLCACQPARHSYLMPYIYANSDDDYPFYRKDTKVKYEYIRDTLLDVHKRLIEVNMYKNGERRSYAKIRNVDDSIFIPHVNSVYLIIGAYDAETKQKLQSYTVLIDDRLTLFGQTTMRYFAQGRRGFVDIEVPNFVFFSYYVEHPPEFIEVTAYFSWDMFLNISKLKLENGVYVIDVYLSSYTNEEQLKILEAWKARW